MDEHQAITCLKAGDLNGLEYLVRTYQVRAVQTAFMIVNDRWLADEIVQAAFLTTAEKIHQFDAHRPFAPWFLRIVINRSLLSCKRRNRYLPLPDDEERPVPSWLADPAQSLQELVETAETRREVLASLQELAPKQRAALVMRYYLDMTDREVSEELRQPLSTTKWSIHSAKARLRSLLRSVFSSRQDEKPPSPECTSRGYENE